MSFEFTGAYAIPGIQDSLETVEKQIWWNRWEDCVWLPQAIDGAARDSGNTAGYTDVLRPGLALGKKTSTGKLLQWDPTATDGTEKLFGFLGHSAKMLRIGSNQDRYIGWVMVGGFLKADNLLIYGQSAFGISGISTEYILRAQMHPRFVCSDLLHGNAFGGWRDIVEKAADYTVLEADNNTLFKAITGAVNFTTPATAKKGLRYGFYNAVNANMTVTFGTADTGVVINDLAADSISFSTANLKIGGMIEIFGDGSLWLTRVSAGQTSDGTTSGQLVTITT